MDTNTVGPGDRGPSERHNGSSSRPVREEVRDYRQQEAHPEAARDRQVMQAVAGGTGFTALCGAAAVVLGILGIVGLRPNFMMTIATIVVGAALLAKGASTAAGASRFSPTAERTERAAVAGGLGVEFIAGAAAIVLGILGLIGKSPLTNVAISMIACGGALLLGGGTVAQTSRYFGERSREEHYAREATDVASGTEMFVGVGAVVLGILSLLGKNPYLLNLISLLGVGSALALSGGAFSTRIASIVRR